MNWFQFWNDLKKREVTVEEYDKLVTNADWFYYMSDQNLSSLHMDTLTEMAEKGSDEFKRIFNRESARRFDNESFYPKSDPTRRYTPPFPEVC